MAALMRLPARQRQVVALRLILDLDTAATAAALGIAPVSFSGAPFSGSCQPYSVSRDALRSVAQFHRDYIAIDPSALPGGTGIAIFDEPGTGLTPDPSGAVATPRTALQHPPLGALLRGIDGPLALGLVYASTQCTG